MKAMILAAGIGTRLRPLTDTAPKALIDVGGATMLEHVVRRLQAAGVDAIIVNLHHLPGAIRAFFQAKGNFGLRVEYSYETDLLDTGGGLKKAAWFFDDGRPFFLHNADVYSDLDLSMLYSAHLSGNAAATLAVRKRASSRMLLFTREGLLCGREVASEGSCEWAAAPVSDADRLAFDGVHVISPELLFRISEDGVFPIHRPYLRLAGAGMRIRSFRSDGSYWKDIGRIDTLEELRRDLASRKT